MNEFEKLEAESIRRTFGSRVKCMVSMITPLFVQMQNDDYMFRANVIECKYVGITLQEFVTKLLKSLPWKELHGLYIGDNDIKRLLKMFFTKRELPSSEELISNYEIKLDLIYRDYGNK